VVAGNTRLKAAQQLGHAEVPVAWFDGSDLDAKAYQIADNRTHEFADWDEPALARILQMLREEDSLEGVGDASLRAVSVDSDGNQAEDDYPHRTPNYSITPDDIPLLLGVSNHLGWERGKLAVLDPRNGKVNKPRDLRTCLQCVVQHGSHLVRHCRTE
jgi:hypothetical protein